MTQDVQTIQQEVTVFVERIPQEITTPQKMEEAQAWFVEIRKKRKDVEAWFKKKFIDPAKALLDSHKKEAADAVQPLNEAEIRLTRAMSAYRKAETDRILKEQAKLNANHDKKVEKAIAKGKDIEEIPPAPILQGPASSVKTESGTLTFRKDHKLVELDANLTPEHFRIVSWKPNTAAIKACLKSGQGVPGWRLDVVEVPVAR